MPVDLRRVVTRIWPSHRRPLGVLCAGMLVATVATVPASVTGRPASWADAAAARSRDRDEPELAFSDSQWASTTGTDAAAGRSAARPVSNDGRSAADQPWGQLTTALGRSGIPEVALAAYGVAQATLAEQDPGCHLDWALVAAIGRVESNHGRYGGAQLMANGYGTRPIRGIPLDGRPGVATIRDTDDGALDGDAVYDRAVGPMQFIPSSWWRVAADGNGDGRRDPNNIFDAAVGAGVYLCAYDTDLRNPADRREAVYRYNHSDSYVATVLSLAAAYLQGHIPGGPGIPVHIAATAPPAAAPLPPVTAPLPPATAGPPLGLADVPGAPPSLQPTPPRPGGGTTTTSTTIPPDTTTTTSTTTVPPDTTTTTTSTTTVPPDTTTTTGTTTPPDTTTTTGTTGTTASPDTTTTPDSTTPSP